MNNAKILEQAVVEQNAVIEQIRRDNKLIQQSRDELDQVVRAQRQAVNDLRSRFNESSSGASRNFGRLAAARPGMVENIINTASERAIRCVEIASGSELTEKEKSGEVQNPECQNLIDLETS
jgi:phosphoglycerate-specific signal transduction histidine kinase